MRKIAYISCFFISWLLISICYSCGEIAPIQEVRLLDSLNQHAYNYRYKDLDTLYNSALQAYHGANLYNRGKAEAANHLGFHAFMQMDFEGAEQYYKNVYKLTSNELERLIADIGLMKIYQRTSMNKEFYDYRNSALNRMSRINEDISLFVDPHEKVRLNYAFSEFHIVSAIYYYYLQQKPEAREEINRVVVDEVLERDTGQWLYYHYIKGAAGLCDTEDLESQTVCEFDNLIIALRRSVNSKDIYFEANTLQGLAEMLNFVPVYSIIQNRRPQALRTLNTVNAPDSLLSFHLAQQALEKFKTYNDIYQIAGAYRTIGTWLNEHGLYQQALDSLTKSLDQVNKHHESYYHCLDTLDRLKPYCPIDSVYIELKWIDHDDIKTVPEWIARIREQLSVAYAGLGMKEASDYNRNIYLDILDYTRQDKELESRYIALKTESRELNFLILLVVFGFLLLIPLFWTFNKRWEEKNKEDILRLKKTLEICQHITSTLPVDAKEPAEIVESVTISILPELISLFKISSIKIGVWDTEEQEMIYPEENKEKNTNDEGAKILYSFELNVPDKNFPIGLLTIYSPKSLTKDDKTLLKVIAPYIAWVIENGMTFISLGDERRRLEKELYVYEQHIVENKRQNLIKRTCMAIVVGLNPFIDRIINEISKLKGKEYAKGEKIKKEKYQYIDELISRINEYNDILALWIKMKQGTLSLNIENFQLEDIFKVIEKGRKTFEMKKQHLSVESTTSIVKADKALTLFMINTLTENARKYTTEGGNIEVYACEGEDYVEISVKDNGRGLSKEDISLILDEKVYDSRQIGLHDQEGVEELRENKGSGFGLMNCKGIIEKYRKTSDLFKVCIFGIESELGKGSRFFFRLPKGIQKTIHVLLLLIGFSCCFSCQQPVESTPESEFVEEMKDEIIPEEDEEFYRLLAEASLFADTAYYCNTIGEYGFAIEYVDSSMTRLNEHYRKFSSVPGRYMSLTGRKTSAEIEWWDEMFPSDYHIILDIRNEAAVAFLALKQWDKYRYNNRAYTTLYKLLGEDVSLAEYCERLENSTNNKIVGIILCILLILILLAGYYTYYIRRRFVNRRNLEEVLDVNYEVFAASLIRNREEEQVNIPERIVDTIFESMNELLIIEALGLAIYNEETHKLEFVFNPRETEEEDFLKEIMKRSFEEESYLSFTDSKYQCFPLLIDVGEHHKCVGVMSFVKQQEIERESDRILSELIARFIAIVIFNSVVKMANKYRDIESAQDEMNRASREESIIHVQNMVLDNCLSTIKHETIYYPNKIKQIIDKLNTDSLTGKEEKENIDTIGELISYYKDIYTILSSCASRQLDEVTFRRSTIPIEELSAYARKYFVKARKNFKGTIELDVNFQEELYVTGDRILLKLLLESLINESLSYEEDGVLQLTIAQDNDFVRFLFTDKRREKSVEELNQLFYPHLSKMKETYNGRLSGIEYLICKQIIRDHDEFAGRRGCRINAEPAPDGGFTVYFTIPIKWNKINR